MAESYVLGTGTVPIWCKGYLMTYKKTNGSVGFVYGGMGRDFELNVGDVLIREDDGRITVKRMEKDEGKGFLTASQETE